MFSYRHAFHAGNHADVLKHITLMATLRHLMKKEAGITLVDTHAGAGLYRLDGDYAEKGGEAADGIVKLMAAMRPATGTPPASIDDLDRTSGFLAADEILDPSARSDFRLDQLCARVRFVVTHRPARFVFLFVRPPF